MKSKEAPLTKEPLSSCRGLSQMIDNQGPIYNPYFGRTLDQAALAVHLSQQGRGQLGRKSTDFRLDMHNKRGCFFQITYAKPSTSSIEDIAPSAWPSGSLYPGGWHRSMEYQSITVREYLAFAKSTRSMILDLPLRRLMQCLTNPSIPSMMPNEMLIITGQSYLWNPFLGTMTWRTL